MASCIASSKLKSPLLPILYSKVTSMSCNCEPMEFGPYAARDSLFPIGKFSRVSFLPINQASFSVAHPSDFICAGLSNSALSLPYESMGITHPLNMKDDIRLSENIERATSFTSSCLLSQRLNAPLHHHPYQSSSRGGS